MPDGKIRGPRTRPFLDRLGEPAIGPRGIADRRKAALQHPFEHLGRLQGQERNRPVRKPGESRVDGEHMDVRVDQPRHQRAACEPDRLGGGALDRPVGHFADMPALHQHMMVLAALAAGAVEHGAIGKNEPGHYTLPGSQIRLDCRARESGPIAAQSNGLSFLPVVPGRGAPPASPEPMDTGRRERVDGPVFMVSGPGPRAVPE